MKIYKEESLRYFEFWGGAVDIVKYLTDEEIDTLEYILVDCNPKGMSETEINDFFWFEEDTIADLLGYSSFDEIMNRENR